MYQLNRGLTFCTIYLILYLCGIIQKGLTKKLYYIRTEHPKITHLNRDYLTEANFTSARPGRNSYIYLVTLNISTLVDLDNDLALDFYFYEFLSNEYKRGFLEMHFKWCDMVYKDPFFGLAVKNALIRSLPPGSTRKVCPVPKGLMALQNMSIPITAIPQGFPFTKGRIYCNFSLISKKVYLGGGYIDMELVEIRNKKNKKIP